MKIRVILFSVVSAILLMLAVLMGLNAIYTISAVEMRVSVYSEEGSSEAVMLQNDLDELVGHSTVLLHTEDVSSLVANYPSFRLEEVTKEYPQRVLVSVSERRELFTIQTEDCYAVFDEEGVYLGTREENISRVDTAANILVSGIEWTANLGEVLQGDRVEELLTVLTVFEEAMPSARMNVSTVTFVAPPVEDTRAEYFEIIMTEGLTVRISNPTYKTEEKARAAVNAYLSLEEGKRAYGLLPVFDLIESGEVPTPVHEGNR